MRGVTKSGEKAEKLRREEGRAVDKEVSRGKNGIGEGER